MALPRQNKFAGSPIGDRQGVIYDALRRARPPAPPAARPSARRDTEIDDNITNLKEEKKLYSQSVDLPSVAANTTTNADVTTATGTCEQGDYVDFLGAQIANHGYIVLGCSPCPARDTIRLRIANVTAGAINPVATTLYFVVNKLVATQ